MLDVNEKITVDQRRLRKITSSVPTYIGKICTIEGYHVDDNMYKL